MLKDYIQASATHLSTRFLLVSSQLQCPVQDHTRHLWGHLEDSVGALPLLHKILLFSCSGLQCKHETSKLLELDRLLMHYLIKFI